MNLYIHLPTNLKMFELFVENKEYLVWGSSKNEKKIAAFFMKNFPGEIMENLSSQYEINFLAARKLKKVDNNIFNRIQGIYYGSDNCEYLAPRLDEIKKAYDLFQQAKKKYYFQWGFVLVTPYVGNKMMESLKPGLDWLNERAGKKWIEVVINDLWVLQYINKNCSNLKPIAGRVFHKLMKTPLVDTYGNKAHVPGQLMRNKSPEEIDKMQEEIVKHQNEFYSSCEATFKPFLNFTKKQGIKRATLDFMEQRKGLYEKEYQLGIDLYYPWALIFTGRLCDTSAIEQPERWNYAINKPCPRTCSRYDLSYKVKTVWYNLLQRWNAAYRSEIDLDRLPEKFLFEPKNRLVFSPFINV